MGSETQGPVEGSRIGDALARSLYYQAAADETNDSIVGDRYNKTGSQLDLDREYVALLGKAARHERHRAEKLLRRQAWLKKIKALARLGFRRG